MLVAKCFTAVYYARQLLIVVGSFTDLQYYFIEQPSSSSISTTTSSVTSMTSLEQEESKGNDSVSDYDEHWGDNENWGDMDTPGEGKNSITPGINRQIPNNTDGWDNEEWGSLEEEPVVSFAIFCEKTKKKNV